MPLWPFNHDRNLGKNAEVSPLLPIDRFSFLGSDSILILVYKNNKDNFVIIGLFLLKLPIV